MGLAARENAVGSETGICGLLLHRIPEFVFGDMEILEAFIQAIHQFLNLGFIGIGVMQRIAQRAGGFAQAARSFGKLPGGIIQI